jgi:hypothetical protein
MWFVTMMRLMWGIWNSPQCTRCGGDHSLSQCNWPVVEVKNTALPVCGGACNQGRGVCTCRKQ